jgi:hypothetical protein
MVPPNLGWEVVAKAGNAVGYWNAELYSAPLNSGVQQRRIWVTDFSLEIFRLLPLMTA